VSFTTLGLDERLMRGLTELGFVRTTPVQSAVYPHVLAGTDLVGCAETGTGKTAAFLLPIMQRLLAATDAGRAPATRVLVLAPTRELAIQIEEDVMGLSYFTPLTSAVVYGGAPMGGQTQALRAGVDIVVATPGRLLDHLNSGIPSFDRLEVLVLDEADRMLDMGFWPDVRRIVSGLPIERQTLLFSATMSQDVAGAAAQIMRQPQLIRLGTTGGLATTITHLAYTMPESEKVRWLVRALRGRHEPALVFVRMKRDADRLARQLADGRVRCAALHADRTQQQRLAAVEGFRAGRYGVLVATDIAARGLDIEGIGYVINVDVPTDTDVYIHRVGRTGRAEAEGTAVTLVSPRDQEAMTALARSLDVAVEWRTAGDPPPGRFPDEPEAATEELPAVDPVPLQ
jgi:ATP-dependent RNA helicase RhlE